jgi:hypothetical protein
VRRPRMSRGDHLYVHRLRRFTHHGIDCGDGTVIHYVARWGKARRVERTSYAEFALRSEVFVRSYRWRLPVERIIANAESRLGAQEYHLVRNNCEHLATWASTGAPTSIQVRGVLMAAPWAVALVVLLQVVGVPLVVLGGVTVGAYAVGTPIRRQRQRRRSAMALAS